MDMEWLLSHYIALWREARSSALYRPHAMQLHNLAAHAVLEQCESMGTVKLSDYMEDEDERHVLQAHGSQYERMVAAEMAAREHGRMMMRSPCTATTCILTT